VYCFTNESMPGICKIGMTTRTAERRLREANVCGTWRPPTPYKCEIAEEVSDDVVKVERTVHKKLEEMGLRVSMKREFFKADIELVKRIICEAKSVEEDPVEDNSSKCKTIMKERVAEVSAKCKTRMKEKAVEVGKKGEDNKYWFEKYLEDGCEIRHTIGETKIWYGIYSKRTGHVRAANGHTYPSIDNFCKEHMKVEVPYRRVYQIHNWNLFEVKKGDGEWGSVTKINKEN
jgi:hypothetical protein